MWVLYFAIVASTAVKIRYTNHLENIQRRFFKYLSFVIDGEYSPKDDFWCLYLSFRMYDCAYAVLFVFGDKCLLNRINITIIFFLSYPFVMRAGFNNFTQFSLYTQTVQPPSRYFKTHSRPYLDSSSHHRIIYNSLSCKPRTRLLHLTKRYKWSRSALGRITTYQLLHIRIKSPLRDPFTDSRPRPLVVVRRYAAGLNCHPKKVDVAIWTARSGGCLFGARSAGFSRWKMDELAIWTNRA